MTDRHPRSRDTEGDPRTPRWVKVQGVFVALLILVVAGMAVGVIGPEVIGFEGGGHGPGRGGH